MGHNNIWQVQCENTALSAQKNILKPITIFLLVPSSLKTSNQFDWDSPVTVFLQLVILCICTPRLAYLCGTALESSRLELACPMLSPSP